VIDVSGVKSLEKSLKELIGHEHDLSYECVVRSLSEITNMLSSQKDVKIDVKHVNFMWVNIIISEYDYSEALNYIL
jgi:hypothetical protein